MHRHALPALILAPFLLAGCNIGSDSSSSQSSTDDSSTSEPPEQGTTFTEVFASATESSFTRSFGDGYGGIAWLDYDRDGDLDMLLTNDGNASNALFSNDGDGTFTDVTIEANAVVMDGSSGVAVGDIDNDGWPDIFLSGQGYFIGPVQSDTVLLHNQGPDINGVVTFVDIAAAAGVPGGDTALSAAFGDINNDGYVDLFITAEGHLDFFSGPGTAVQHSDKLYLNNGDLTFTDISDSYIVNSPMSTGALGSCAASFSHFDDDEYIDLFVAVCNEVNFIPTPWHVYRNNGDNTFTDVAPMTQLDKGGFWMSSAFGDIDNDGDFDIFSTNLGGGNRHHLWRNNGDGTYVDIASDEMADNFWSWGATFADFDNDGFQDLYYGGEGQAPFARGGTGYLFMNDGNSRFTRDLASGIPDLDGKGITGISKADFNGDGFVDLAIMTGTGQPPLLFQNQGNENNWVALTLVGISSNAMAIGARIEIVSNSGKFQAREILAGSSFVSSESQWPVFGLGSDESVDVIVYWPGGEAEEFIGLDAQQRHVLTEGTGSAL